MPPMPEYLFHLVFGIIIYQYRIWYEALTMVPLKQCYIKYRMYLHPGWQFQLGSIAPDHL